MADDDPAAETIRAAMAELVANFTNPTDITPTLEAVTSHAVELIAEIDFADILLVDGDGHRSVAATAAIATELDVVQTNLREGPCFAAATEHATILCPDLTAEPRWPEFAAAAVRAGVGSMMSFQLYTATRPRRGAGGRGALNLFSYGKHDFSVEAQALGAMLATHAAAALIAADRQTQFDSALAGRDVLGQAKGVLMERFKIDAVHAFNLMVRLSQDTNTPVRVIAQRIVETPDQ
jgi:GAF domain-containing protein